MGFRVMKLNARLRSLGICPHDSLLRLAEALLTEKVVNRDEHIRKGQR
jgi:hypothetical protein